MREIAEALCCSEHKVVYWMDKHGIRRRSLSDAIYLKNHPNGDPFTIRKPRTPKDWELYGLGIGLYWGEGGKASKNAVRLGNTDPALLRTFVRFLVDLCGVKLEDLRFGVQIFNDLNPNEALAYWAKELNVKRTQFYHPVLSPSQSTGTYRRHAMYGVLSVYYNNRNLQRWILGQLPR